MDVPRSGRTFLGHAGALAAALVASLPAGAQQVDLITTSSCMSAPRRA